jgi:proteasome lid subunit RPN8/RPN11
VETPEDPLAAVAASLAALAEDDPLREVCGLVVRAADGSLEPWPLPNGASDPGRGFEIPAPALLDAMRRLDERRAGLIAVYHSHPVGGAGLSRRDLDLALAGGQPALPGVAQVVVALEAGRAACVRVYRWCGSSYLGRDLWRPKRAAALSGE